MTSTPTTPGDPDLAKRLTGAIRGEVRFDAFTRGIYSTDASHYQIEPLGVVFPEDVADVAAVMAVARERGVPVLPRGGGTSQCGQTVGRALVVDVSRRLTDIAPVDIDAGTVEVAPGVILDDLNRALKPHGLWFPVDPSTSNRATLGGMAGNNSAGARSLRYGMMVDNVAAVEALLPDGRRVWLGDGHDPAAVLPAETIALRALYARYGDEIVRRTPKTMRNVAGYNLGRLAPEREDLAQLLVGSEGTLTFFTRLRLKLAALPTKRVLGVCHFTGLHAALDAVQHVVTLGPSAVELVDQNVLRLAADRPDYRAAMDRFVRGTPGALLLVEFAATADGDDPTPRLNDLSELLGGLGYPDAVVRAVEPSLQAAVWSVRKAGLNIVMSMAGPRKPVSFIEDCAVPLEHLAEYADRIDAIFARNGASGTWYAHASVGCLHVRPALNLRDPDDIGRMRRIAEETHEVVRAFGGTHSGEHGDGIVRSEFLETMLGARMAEAFREVKQTFDPGGIMNPGKIVAPPRMDDRSLFRLRPGLREGALPVVLDWSAEGGVLGAVERCNNNGACRKSDPGVMCPSFRVTRDERHSTRGRANALRLALTGQLGVDGLDSPEMAEAMALCISCKGCARECPTGVDMAALKLEWQHRRNVRFGVPTRERVLAGLPRAAPWLSRFAPIVNAVSGSSWLRSLGEPMSGISARRQPPRWSSAPWSDDEIPGRSGGAEGAGRAGTASEMLLFVDTFTRWFDPSIARAALSVLRRLGPSVRAAASADGRPLCCGRTYLSAGMLDEARVEAERLIRHWLPVVRAGTPIVGLEPSCVLTIRDELPRLVPTADARAVAAGVSLFEEAVDAALEAGATLDFDGDPRRATVHTHCHQKAAGLAGVTARLLGRVPGMVVHEIESGCCGMAGAFGYHAEHYDISMAMAELDLLPAIRATDADMVVVAVGTSCRAQIHDGVGRTAVHPAEVLASALVPERA